MSFRLVPKSVILNDLEQRNGHYFALFQRIRVASGWTILQMVTQKLTGHGSTFIEPLPLLTHYPIVVNLVQNLGDARSRSELWRAEAARPEMEPGHGSLATGWAILAGWGRVSVSDPVFDLVLSFNMFFGVVSTEYHHLGIIYLPNFMSSSLKPHILTIYCFLVNLFKLVPVIFTYLHAHCRGFVSIRSATGSGHWFKSCRVGSGHRSKILTGSISALGQYGKLYCMYYPNTIDKLRNFNVELETCIKWVPNTGSIHSTQILVYN